jgi:catechol 2,3-dioxygenase-like lactoylglutathione lyase family enzyme
MGPSPGDRFSETGEWHALAMTADFPTHDVDLTHLLVVGDVERSRRWYEEVLGATVHRAYGGTSVAMRLVEQWLLLVTGGEPTADKPTVTFAAPSDPDTVSAEMIFGVPDCRAAYETLLARGAEFLTPPVEYEWEVRAFFRDPDGHLFEISESRGG